MFPASRFKLLYTDSLIYDIECPDVYEVMKHNLQFFDTSDNHENNRSVLPLVNKKVIGLMKDECCGGMMTEFVGLRSKMYSVRVTLHSKDLWAHRTIPLNQTILLDTSRKYILTGYLRKWVTVRTSTLCKQRAKILHLLRPKKWRNWLVFTSTCQTSAFRVLKPIEILRRNKPSNQEPWKNPIFQTADKSAPRRRSGRSR